MKHARGDEKYIILGEPEGKNLLRRPRHRSEDNVKVVLKGNRM
jgi:hypothetical protein